MAEITLIKKFFHIFETLKLY